MGEHNASFQLEMAQVVTQRSRKSLRDNTSLTCTRSDVGDTADGDASRSPSTTPKTAASGTVEKWHTIRHVRHTAEMEQRFKEKQYLKRRVGRPKPLSLEGPTNADHIALYRLEKGLREERNAPRLEAASAMLEETRRRLVAATISSRKGGRPRKSL